MKDKRGSLRGSCEECDCAEYERIGDLNPCDFCGHFPRSHTTIMSLDPQESSSSDISTKSHSFSFLKENLELVDPLMEVEDSEHRDHVDVSSKPENIKDPLEPSTVAIEDTSSERTLADVTNAECNIGLLPSFSKYVEPYLNGTAIDHQIPTMRRVIIEDIVHFLDSRNLITDPNNMKRRWQYCSLQHTILKEYPNIIREKCNRKRQYKGELSFLITRVSEKRRHAVMSHKEPAFATPSEAFAILENLVSYNKLSKGQRLRAIKLSKPVRAYVKELPHYLLDSEAITLEVELTFDMKMDTLERTIEKYLKIARRSNKEITDLVSVASYLSNDPCFLRFPIPEEIPLQNGPCVFVNDPTIKSEAVIVCSKEQSIHLSKITSTRAILMAFGIYYIFNLDYPTCFSQICGLLQTLLTKDAYNTQFHKRKLKGLLQCFGLSGTQPS